MKHKRLLLIAAACFGFFLFPPVIYAADYFVSVTGNDGNPGTRSAPWKTIQKAAVTASEGDTVTISSGVYNENITISRSGTPAAPIVFQGANNPIIVASTPTTRSCLNTSTNACLLGILSITGSNILFKNMEVSGPSVKPGDIAGITSSGSNNVIEHNFIHNTWREGVSLTSGSYGNSIRDNTIVYGSLSGINFDGKHHLIEGNTITHSTTRFPDGTVRAGATDPDGMRFFGSDTTVRHNIIKDIFLDEMPESDDPHSDCFQTWQNAANITFDGNYCELENSTTYLHPMVKFMMISTPQNSTAAVVGSLTIVNNIFISKSVSTLWTPVQIGNDTCSTIYPIKNIVMAHNTFVHAGNVSGHFAILMRCADTVTIKNNAIYNFGTPSYPYIYQDMNNNVNVTISNNSVYNSTGVVPKNGPYPGDNIADIWMKPPAFVNIGSFNVHLTSSSPLVNRGAAMPVVTNDFDGNVRPQGTGYDIGAFEFVSGGITPTTFLTPTPAIMPSPTIAPSSVLSVCKIGCPYSTIQSAVNAVSAGKTVEVQAGTYSEAINIPINGSSTARITLRAKAGDTVWIDGGSLGNASNINIGNHSFWNISGLKMRLAAQGSPLAADGPADGVTVGQGGNNILLENLTIEAPNGDGIDLRGANYNIRILNNEIYDMRKSNPNYEGDGHGIHVLQQYGLSPMHDILVKGNFTHDAHGKACLALSDYTALNAPHPTNILFEGNRVQDCTNGIKINADGVFRYNLIVDTGKYTSGVEKPDNCFQAFTHDAENNVRDGQVYNNTTVGCNNAYNFDLTYNGSTPAQTFSVFRNNIACNPRTYFIRTSATNFTSIGNNLYYKIGGGGSYVGYTPDPSSITKTDPQFNSDYSLKNTSPAIDKGIVIYTGQAFAGSSPDMGAFEYTVLNPAPTSIPGDLNGDGHVDLFDYNELVTYFGNPYTIYDYNVLVANFGK